LKIWKLELPASDQITFHTAEGIRPALVLDWLRKLVLSPKYKRHLRSLLYRLFDKEWSGNCSMCDAIRSSWSKWKAPASARNVLVLCEQRRL